jgi:hypothetical protein
MPDFPIKKRLARAKAKARADLEADGFEVIVSDNRPICLVAIQGGKPRLIRICVDKIVREDINAMKKYACPSTEIWLRKHGDTDFLIHKI